MYLEQIQKANDIKKFTDEEMEELALEIRKFLIESHFFHHAKAFCQH